MDSIQSNLRCGITAVRKRRSGHLLLSSPALLGPSVDRHISEYLSLCLQPPVKSDPLRDITHVWKGTKTSRSQRAEPRPDKGVLSLTPEGISAIGDATKGRFFSLFFEANTRTNRHRLRKHWCKDIFALSGSFVKQRFSFSLRGLFYYDRWLSW